VVDGASSDNSIVLDIAILAIVGPDIFSRLFYYSFFPDGLFTNPVQPFDRTMGTIFV
jgi:hypothetical protein